MRKIFEVQQILRGSLFSEGPCLSSQLYKVYYSLNNLFRCFKFSLLIYVAIKFKSMKINLLIY